MKAVACLAACLLGLEMWVEVEIEEVLPLLLAWKQ